MNMPQVRTTVLFSVCFFCACPAFAQHLQADDQTAVDMVMTGMYGPYAMTRESSGTSWQPESTPVDGFSWMSKDWMLSMAGFINLIRDDQTGKRGDDKTFSSSMFMFMAQRELGKGTLGLRSMLSLDPLMGKSGYPLLLQTGETADGTTPLIDRQHPHDLFMELACTYSFTLSEESSLFTYFGLPGEPALGPPAFMHRFSGMDIPVAPITHHWLDSTHITYGVATLGYIWNTLKIEGSAFNGREPDQDRWDIEAPRFNSASVRLSFNPTKDWAMQASFGYLDSPEQLEPNTDVRRTTVSVSYNKVLDQANWQTTLAWGRNDSIPGDTLDGFLLESTACIRNTHTLFGRMERVAKNDLFDKNGPLSGDIFTVNKISMGYIYDFHPARHIKLGLGSSLDINILPDKLKSSYGNTPLGYTVFIRVKLD